MAVKAISGSSLILGMDQSDNPAGGSETFVNIGGSSSCTVNISQETIDTTSKDSGGRKSFIGGASSWTLDCEAFFTDGTSDGETVRPSTLFDALDGGYRVAIKFHCDTGQTGAKKYQGWGYITSLSVNGAVSEWSTYSISIQGDGQLTQSAV
tara:strand:+ start:2490 stop:2945 length:456 start_codon:yes stop_codon:yes gene_type:complete